MSEQANHFTEITRRVIEQYQEDHPAAKNSLQVIADRSQASYTTIHNVMIKNKPISMKMAKNIISNLSPNLTLGDISKLLDASSLESFSRDITNNCFDSKIIPDDLEDFFKEESLFELLILAFSDTGLSREEVVLEFGQSGVRKIQRMLDAGLVKEIEGVYFGITEENSLFLSRDTVRKMAQFSLNNLDAEKEGQWLSFQSNSYTKEQGEKIKEIFKDTFKAISKIPTSKDGDFVLSSSLLLQIIDYKNNNKIKKGFLQ